MGSFSDKFGPQYAKPKGYIVEPTQNKSYKHRFGGASWQVIDPQPVEDGPALLLVLDLTDPRLSDLGITSCSELPVCSYINSDVWLHEQVYQVNSADHTVALVQKEVKSPTILGIEDRLPNPLPEKSIDLKEMEASHYPVDENLYWENTDDFLGGQTFFRVAGSALWLQETKEVSCSCDKEMKFLMGIGHEGWDGPFQYIDDAPFFLGEAALYCFFCDNCMELRVISQTT